ncbi:MAG TPA: tetratricopeptide repeat protein, partial [Polyangiaceae bacterium]|nr:tetratricopeptide repeat protein [Polyangiaceae bacterium]
MPTRRVKGAASILVAVALSSPFAAYAQSDEQRAAARELATSGAEAFKEGKYDQALDSFTKAESLYHALPHLLFIARSHAKLGQYVKAREAYMKVIKEGLPANAPQAARDAQTSAQSEVGNIEPKIGRVTISVAQKEQAKDLVVTIDGVAIASVLVGAPVPIDPGDHAIEGVATGFRAKAQVHVDPGQRQDVPLTLEPDASAVPPSVAGAAVAAPPPVQPVAAPPPAAAPPPPANSAGDQGTSNGPNAMRIGSYVAFGVGAVGLIGGTIFTAQYAGKRSDASDICNLPND